MTEVPASARPARTIEPPPRASPVGTAVILAAVAVHAAAVLAPRAADRAIAVAAGLVLVMAMARRERAVLHWPLLAALLVLWPATGAPPVWPLYVLGPLVAYAAAMVPAPRLRRSIGWLRPGRLDRATLALTGATVVVSLAAVGLWCALARTELHAVAAMIPAGSTFALLAVAVGVAAVNALLQEVIWRGVMLDALDAAVGPNALAIAVQAASFGVAYAAGLPRAGLAAVVATVYGAALGALRRRAEGLLAPVLAHVIVDATVIALLARLA